MNNPVQDAREAFNMTRMDLAHQSGLSYMTITSIENGYPRSIRKQTAERLAVPLYADPAELTEEYKTWRESLKKEVDHAV